MIQLGLEVLLNALGKSDCRIVTDYFNQKSGFKAVFFDVWRMDEKLAEASWVYQPNSFKVALYDLVPHQLRDSAAIVQLGSSNYLFRFFAEPVSELIEGTGTMEHKAFLVSDANREYEMWSITVDKQIYNQECKETLEILMEDFICLVS